MAVTNRSSALYTQVYISKQLVDARDYAGRMVPIPFFHTVVSGETGGASAGVRDTVNLCVLPANCIVLNLVISSNALWASAGVNGTLQLGDSGNSARYMQATEMYTALGSPLASDFKNMGLAFAGQNYRPTVDTIVLAEWRVANPTVGAILKGYFTVSLQE